MAGDREASNAACRRYYARHRQEQIERSKNYAKIHKEERDKYSEEYRNTNRELMNERGREYRAKLRYEVINAYGSKCVCCGETTFQFLAIDHINGTMTYLWLKNHGWPPGFQVLCHNCNLAKSLYGICPHKEVSHD
jgi:hypothetical protein